MKIIRFLPAQRKLAPARAGAFSHRSLLPAGAAAFFHSQFCPPHPREIPPRQGLRP